jgi:hypothetical protein
MSFTTARFIEVNIDYTRGLLTAAASTSPATTLRRRTHGDLATIYATISDANPRLLVITATGRYTWRYLLRLALGLVEGVFLDILI